MAPTKYFVKVPLVGRFMPFVGGIGRLVESPLQLVKRATFAPMRATFLPLFEVLRSPKRGGGGSALTPIPPPPPPPRSAPVMLRSRDRLLKDNRVIIYVYRSNTQIMENGSYTFTLLKNRRICIGHRGRAVKTCYICLKL